MFFQHDAPQATHLACQSMLSRNAFFERCSPGLIELTASSKAAGVFGMDHDRFSDAARDR